MWAFLSTMPDLQRRADSLEAAADFAEAVIVGQYVGVERGQNNGTPGNEDTSWSAIALIKPEIIAKGQPEVGPDGNIRVAFILTIGGKEYPEERFADLERSVPSDPALLFLFSWATYFDRTNTEVPERLAALDVPDLYKTIGGDGAIRVVDGRLKPPPYVDGWPLELNGLSVSEILPIIQSR